MEISHLGLNVPRSLFHIVLFLHLLLSFYLLIVVALFFLFLVVSRGHREECVLTTHEDF